MRVLLPLRHIRKPGFHGILFRRTNPEITNPGGLWIKLLSYTLPPVAAGCVVTLNTVRRNNVRIAFRHLEHEQDKYSHQGGQYAYIGFDELTHFTEGQFFYMISRNRSKCGIRPYVRATCNPHPGWVKRFLAPWVDEEFQGKPAKPGELRWFIRSEGKIKWVAAGTKHAKSVTFIPAFVTDNQVLMNATRNTSTTFTHFRRSRSNASYTATGVFATKGLCTLALNSASFTPRCGSKCHLHMAASTGAFATPRLLSGGTSTAMIASGSPVFAIAAVSRSVFIPRTFLEGSSGGVTGGPGICPRDEAGRSHRPEVHAHGNPWCVR